MNVQAAWKRGYTGKNVVVTILDDGIERNHPDLAPNYVSGAGNGDPGGELVPWGQHAAQDAGRQSCVGLRGWEKSQALPTQTPLFSGPW